MSPFLLVYMAARMFRKTPAPHLGPWPASAARSPPGARAAAGLGLSLLGAQFFQSGGGLIPLGGRRVQSDLRRPPAGLCVG